MSIKRPQFEAAAFFYALRGAMKELKSLKYGRQGLVRQGQKILIDLRQAFKLPESLTEFIDDYLVQHPTTNKRKSYKASKEYAVTLPKWQKHFHTDACKTCGKAITKTYRGKELGPLCFPDSEWCSQACQNKDPCMREKNRASVQAMFDNPKRKAKWLRKQEATSLRLYGVRHQNQRETARQRISENSKNQGYQRYNLKTLVHAGHTWENLQGYEPAAIKWLIDDLGIAPYDIKAGRPDMPCFKYWCKEKKMLRTYFPDILVKDKIFIEVKCDWTMGDKRNVNAKLKAVLAAGYGAGLIWFFNKTKNSQHEIRFKKTWKPTNKIKTVNSKTPSVIRFECV